MGNYYPLRFWGFVLFCVCLVIGLIIFIADTTVSNRYNTVVKNQTVNIAGFSISISDTTSRFEIPVIITKISKDSVIVRMNVHSDPWYTTAVFKKITNNTYMIGDKKTVLVETWFAGYESGWYYTLKDDYEPPVYDVD